MTPDAARHRSGARRAPRVTPRYGRLAALGIAFAVTLVAVAGGIGLLPTDPRPTAYADSAPDAVRLAGETARASGSIDPTTLASHTGAGRRVVFDQSAQRFYAGDMPFRSGLAAGFGPAAIAVHDDTDMRRNPEVRPRSGT